MHIEPGVLDAAKIATANATAIGTLTASAYGFVRRPADLARTVLAAGFFSIFMQLWHMQVGPSELHLIGASAIYFTFGFLPTLFGFALGLALQGLLFEPQDLVHLGVNSLSLMVPLIAVHAAFGHRFFRRDGLETRWSSVLKFDAAYYAGVVAMVGFWLALGREPTPFASWATFAASYLPLAALEPLFTLLVLKGLKRFEASAPVRTLSVAPQLRLA
ncbi:MAG TPA: energy-coupling factor ABC transporter permease [Rhodoblastus sp.]|nr:energy-coupling factor ABC transporter permease [Rhodoblastus sp.]